jgi:hypothetical protein
MPGVSQISPPMRIVLGVAVAFLALYMVALRPKSEVAPVAPAATPAGNVATGNPATTRLGKAVEAAEGAAAATDAQQTAEGAAAGVAPATSTGTSVATATKRAEKSSASKPSFAGASVDTTGLPKPVAKAIHRHDVLALLFTNERSADDRAVQRAVKSVKRFDGDVFVHSAPLKSIARYGRITRGADVEQSPTVVVVNRRMKATTLVGYVDALTIEQAVVDAMRSSGGLFADAYLRRVNKSCSSTIHDMYAVAQAMTPSQAPSALRGRVQRWDGFVSALRAKPAPARWRAFNRAMIADAVAYQSILHQQVRVLGSSPTTARVAQVARTLRTRTAPMVKRFNKRADRHHLVFCGSIG